MQYKKYLDVPEKYRFDLEKILQGSTIEKLFDEAKKLSGDLIAKKDTYLNSKEGFLQVLKLEDDFGKLGNRIINYIQNNISVNVVSQEFNRMMQQFYAIYYSFKAQWGDDVTRILKAAKNIKLWIENKDFAPYRKQINFILKSKKHRLDNSVEDYLTKAEKGNIKLAKVFSVLANSELNFGYAVSSDKKRKVKITLGNYFSLLEDKDEEFRKSAMINYNLGSARHRQTFAQLLLGHFRNVSSDSLLRKYESTVHSYLFQDQIDVKLVTTMYEQISKNVGILQKYWTNYGKFFKAKQNKTFQLWDLRYKLVKVKSKYTVEEAQEKIKQALKPLGKKYGQLLDDAFSKRWIDYYPVDNKRSGAYSIGGSYPLERKYIMMNYDGTLNSVKTLAHELGHSMHSYFSDTTQPYSLSQYPIFLAEIASIFNELMLNEHLIQTTEDKEIQFHLLSESILDFQGTVFRQAQFSEYEFSLYSALDKEEPLGGFEDLQALYKKVSQKYKVHDLKSPFPEEEQEMLSVIVPHFYYDFYVYKYVIGYIVANVFYNKYKKNGEVALKDYINKFLSMGGSKWPADLLKESGIDIYSPAIYQEAFAVLQEKVDRFVTLGKEIFKTKK